MSDFTTHKGEPLVCAIININGSDRGKLVEQYASVHRALMRAEKSLMHTAPHGRDFQTCDDPLTMLARALAQHNERMRTLQALDREIVALAMTLQKGIEHDAIPTQEAE